MPGHENFCVAGFSGVVVGEAVAEIAGGCGEKLNGGMEFVRRRGRDKLGGISLRLAGRERNGSGEQALRALF